MYPTKALRLDDLPTLSYHRFWHIIGSKVSAYCVHILNNGGDLNDVNHTNIVLIPTKSLPINMTLSLDKLMQRSVENCYKSYCA